ncbi:MAG: hypothetical protein FWF08_08200 [Oscillospiraceae bacterium]|nr:hypothetical protein [Oscillospiraceae bacterium]
MTKKERQNLILKLIDKYGLGTQEGILEKLLENGVSVTQATVSRDIRELKLVKQPTSGGAYMYNFELSLKNGLNVKYYNIFSQTVYLADHAGNICVLKCHAGTASAACAAADEMELPEVAGTLAGDDTVFILCRSESAAANIKNILEELLEK